MAEKCCPYCGGKISFIVDEGVWICHKCGSEMEDYEINPREVVKRVSRSVVLEEKE